jgi:hypothetical protein
MDTNQNSGVKKVNQETEEKAIQEAQAAKDAQTEADDLKAQATDAKDSTEKDELLSKARKREEEAHGHSQEATRIASGAWQWTLGGVGVGTGIGTGTGAVVGTLVGTIASIPFAGLGGLVGLSVGIIHGPGQPQQQKDKPLSEEEKPRAVIQALDQSRDAGKGAGPGNRGDKD